MYILLGVLVVVFSFAMFPVWLSNVEFSGAIVAGIGYWMYGKRYRFHLAFLWIIYNFALSEVYADILEDYQSRLFANLLMVLMAFLIGELREHYDLQKEATKRLDDTVAEQNRQLDFLVAGLIERRERTRIEQGEELHNGVGQEMTGIQLYCETLAERMPALPDPAASMIFSLRDRARETHRIVRWTARTLFPVKINEIGLLAALRELVSCLEEAQGVEFIIGANTEAFDISTTTALQFYRIAQETLFYLLEHSDASRIRIDFEAQPRAYRLEITHNGKHLEFGSDKGVDVRVIEYRLRKISGIMTTSHIHAGLKKIIYLVPQESDKLVC